MDESATKFIDTYVAQRGLQQCVYRKISNQKIYCRYNVMPPAKISVFPTTCDTQDCARQLLQTPVQFDDE